MLGYGHMGAPMPGFGYTGVPPGYGAAMGSGGMHPGMGMGMGMGMMPGMMAGMMAPPMHGGMPYHYPAPGFGYMGMQPRPGYPDMYGGGMDPMRMDTGFGHAAGMGMGAGNFEANRLAGASAYLKLLGASMGAGLGGEREKGNYRTARGSSGLAPGNRRGQAPDTRRRRGSTTRSSERKGGGTAAPARIAPNVSSRRGVVDVAASAETNEYGSDTFDSFEDDDETSAGLGQKDEGSGPHSRTGLHEGSVHSTPRGGSAYNAGSGREKGMGVAPPIPTYEQGFQAVQLFVWTVLEVMPTFFSFGSCSR